MGGFSCLSSFASGQLAFWAYDDSLDLESHTIFADAVFRGGSNKTANSLSAQLAGWTLYIFVGCSVGLHLISPFSTMEERKTNTYFTSFG